MVPLKPGLCCPAPGCSSPISQLVRDKAPGSLVTELPPLRTAFPSVSLPQRKLLRSELIPSFPREVRSAGELGASDGGKIMPAASELHSSDSHKV